MRQDRKRKSPRGRALLVLRALLALLAIGPALGLAGRASAAGLAQQLELAPQLEFGALFRAVQSAGLYPDSKVFPDAVPRAPPAEIMQRFRAQHPRTPEELAQFVAANFELPAAPASGAGAGVAPARLPLATHIDALWDQLTRQPADTPRWSSLLPLPQQYVVPGGRFRELYYWDSYFTLLGVADSGRPELVAHTVQDFAALIERYGHIPNGTRSYYLSRSQPPFFFAMVALLSSDDPAAAWARWLPQLRREHAFWMEGATELRPGHAHRRVVALPGNAHLNRYWDDADTPRDESFREDTALARTAGREPRQLYRDLRAAAESGWDFSSRWFADGESQRSIITTEIIPVDLNSLLYGLEQAIRAGCERAGNAACEREFAQRAEARRHAMDHYLWDEARGVYVDYRWTQRRQLRALTAATVYPLFVGAASQQQAARVATGVRDTLLQPGGLATTTVHTGQQWDAPNGWAPLQWLAVAGLRRYNNAPLASVIACRWLVNVNTHYEDSGKLVEKYDVQAPGRGGGGGEYPLQDGFGWTNGVTRRLLTLYPEIVHLQSVEQCPDTPAADSPMR